MNKKKSMITVLLLLLIVPIVLAQPFTTAINNAFMDIFNTLKQVYVIYGATIILFFMLFYGVFATGLRKVPAFGGGNELSRPGKVIALSLSALATLSLLWFTRHIGIQNILNRYLTPMGLFGGIAIGFVFFALIYWGYGGEARNKALAFAAAGFAMFAVGKIINSTFLQTVGGIIGVGGIIALLIGMGKGEDEGRRWWGDRDRLRRDGERGRAWGTGYIYGTVTNAHTGYAIGGAKVWVKRTGGGLWGFGWRAITCNNDGTYRLNLPSGRYKVYASANNFANSSVIKIDIPPGQNIQHNIALIPIGEPDWYPVIRDIRDKNDDYIIDFEVVHHG
jgi:hypothetical protein